MTLIATPNLVELKGFSNPVIAVRKWLEPKLPDDVSVDEESFNEAVRVIGYQPYMPGRVIDSIEDANEVCRLAYLQVVIQHPFVYFRKMNDEN